MTPEEGVRLEIQAMMQKGHRALSAARDHLEKKDYDFASSKAYYAVFHFVQAILLSKRLSFSKHSAVISAFNQHFIKSGIFDKRFSALIERLFKHRQIGDYAYLSGIEREEAQDDLRIAEDMVAAIEKYLTEILEIEPMEF